VNVPGHFSAGDISNRKLLSAELMMRDHTTLSYPKTDGSRISGSSLDHPVAIQRMVEA
jgi:hypothetical protein